MLNQCGETVATAPIFADKVYSFGTTILVVDYIEGIYELEVQCKEGFYGRDCLKGNFMIGTSNRTNEACDPCDAVGGTCNGGIFGDGTCSCNAGYSGSACDTQFGREDFFSHFSFANEQTPLQVRM
jgi:hypothetical protein